MDGTETRILSINPEVPTKVNVCVTNNLQIQSVYLMHYCEPAPMYDYYPHLVLSKLSKSFPLAI